jgi:hypothetical protein
MQQSLENIKQHLEKIITLLRSSIPSDEPFGNAHGNWSFPGLTRAELVDDAQALIDLIDAKGGDEVGAAEGRLVDYAPACNISTQQRYRPCGAMLVKRSQHIFSRWTDSARRLSLL